MECCNIHLGHGQARVGFSKFLFGLLLISYVTIFADQAFGGQELLDFVRDAHKSARESIHTLSCRIIWEYEDKKKMGQSKESRESFSGEYWQSLESARGKLKEQGRKRDYVVKDSTRESIQRQPMSDGREQAAAMRMRFASKYLPRDAYALALMAINIPTTIDFLFFEQFVEQANRIVSAERKLINEKEMVVISLLMETETQGRKSRNMVEIHFDPSVNYLIRKVIYPNRDEEVVQFKEYTRGVFFPVEVITNAKSGAFRSTSRFTAVKVNEPLPNGIFNLTYPYGIYVTDSIHHTKYKVDSGGRRISAEEPYGLPTAFGGSFNKSGQQAPGTATKEEPLLWTRWLLPVSMFILVVGVAGACIRRWRSKTPEV